MHTDELHEKESIWCRKTTAMERTKGWEQWKSREASQFELYLTRKKTHSFHHSLSYKPFMQASWSQNEKLRSSIGQIAIMCYAWEETSMSNYNGTDPIMYHVNDIQECIMIYTNFGATSGVGISDLGWSCIVHCCGLYVNLFMLYFFILYVDMFH